MVAELFASCINHLFYLMRSGLIFKQMYFSKYFGLIITKQQGAIIKIYPVYKKLVRGLYGVNWEITLNNKTALQIVKTNLLHSFRNKAN